MPPAFPRLLTLLGVLVLFVMVSPRAGRGSASATKSFQKQPADDSCDHFYVRKRVVVNRNVALDAVSAGAIVNSRTSVDEFEVPGVCTL
jgi:hypothetical protein